VLLLTGCSRKEEKTEPPEEAASTQVARAAESAEKAEVLPGAWEVDNRNNLLKLIARYGQGGPEHDPSRPPVVVFDFDNTCIRGDMGRAFYDWMVRERKLRFNDEVWKAVPADKRPAIQKAWKKLASLPAEQQAASLAMKDFRKRMHQAYWSLCYKTPPEKCYPWQVRFYAGYTPDEITAMAEKVVQLELNRPLGSEQIMAGPDDPSPAITSTGIRFYKEIHQLMNLLRNKGFRVWVVTAGPEWVVKSAAKNLGVDPSLVVGMRTRLAEGKLTSTIDPPPTFKEGKVKAIEKYIGVKPVLAVGDSWTDAEMLEYAEHALLIDRGYADLKRKAVKAGWWIQPPFPVN
jgi:phosphoserine phosphatase